MQKSHIRRIHDGIRKHKCDSCEKCFAHIGDLNRHKRNTHDGIKDYHCSFCDKSFTRAYFMKKHVTLIHEVKKDQIVCEFCQKMFADIRYLKDHIKFVHGNKDYNCEHCDKSFSVTTSFSFTFFYMSLPILPDVGVKTFEITQPLAYTT